ncbi:PENTATRICOPEPTIDE REPEAT-CONTAINING PROTEIN [Salix purpurea]|uniref:PENTATRICOPEPTIDE REPEAT-CONTAINING PROTEIN n=1 Tax=Salix purpurea TaxID=77065 RepID=A0A9Q1A1I4_SALPP|nr:PENTATRICOPEPTIDE REPEAT-CONTAINING PROTEIN [Salix purpurea]
MPAQNILKTLILNLCGKGYFLVASKFLCDLSHDVGHLDAHVVLLKCLADSEEVPIAVEHVKANSRRQIVAFDGEMSSHLCPCSQGLPTIRAGQEENSNPIRRPAL